MGSTINRILDRLDVPPQARRSGAAIVLLVSILGWPISALTFASGEPPTVLGLSWIAISLTALDVLFTADVRVQQEEDSD